jgi:cobalt-zinc-cadmium resistance protein CzcA
MEGEKCGIMMLKGANSKQVITDVITRITEIEKRRTMGVYKWILERSELVGKTTFTVAENLI